MKLTIREQELIQDLLGSATNYKETYEELYDHILSALDQVSEEMPFEDALYNIMENELGGKKGIALIEKRYTKVAIKEIVNKYIGYFGKNLISPVIIPVLICLGLFYWWLTGLTTPPSFIWIICMYINFVPLAFRKIEIVKARRLGYYGKSSIISIAFPYLKFLPVSVLVIVVIFEIVVRPKFMVNIYNPTVVTAYLLLNVLNAMAFYRLCKDEFKTSLAV